MPEPLGIADLSGADRKAVQGLKGKFNAFAKSYGVIREKAKDLAPQFSKLFARLKAQAADAERAFGLADFARMFDESVPTNAAERDGKPGYRTHPAYMSLDYMMRVQRGTERPRGRQGVRDLATAKLERALATVVQIMKDPTPLWEAVRQELGLQDRGLKQLQNRVAKSEPLIDLSGVIKPINAERAKIIHMEPQRQPTADQVAAGRRASRNLGEAANLLEQHAGKRKRAAA